jgi:hypothetical protein
MPKCTEYAAKQHHNLVPHNYIARAKRKRHSAFFCLTIEHFFQKFNNKLTCL